MRLRNTSDLIFELLLLFGLICALLMILFTPAWYVVQSRDSYTVTQNGTTYTGKILQGHSTVSVTDKDNNTVVLDAAYGPISIRTSNLDNSR